MPRRSAHSPTRSFVATSLIEVREQDLSFRVASPSTIHDSLLRALLVIDGDDTVDPMPRYEEMLSSLRQSVIEGDIDRDHDLEALHVALSALTRGYRIFREAHRHRRGRAR